MQKYDLYLCSHTARGSSCHGAFRNMHCIPTRSEKQTTYDKSSPLYDFQLLLLCNISRPIRLTLQAIQTILAIQIVFLHLYQRQARTFLRLCDCVCPSVIKTHSAEPISCLVHRATRVLHCAIVTRAAVLMFPLYSRPSSVIRWGCGGWGVLHKKINRVTEVIRCWIIVVQNSENKDCLASRQPIWRHVKDR